jgi:hypothetical protein
MLADKSTRGRRGSSTTITQCDALAKQFSLPRIVVTVSLQNYVVFMSIAVFAVFAVFVVVM